MLKIRLRRAGKKGQPSYRIVVTDSRWARDGRFVEWIGTYNPLSDPPDVTLEEEKALTWLQKGAQPSDAVSRILKWKGILSKEAKE